MSNHVHATIAFRESKKSINTIVGDGKRFMSYEIVKRLTASGQTAILQQLQDGVNCSHKKEVSCTKYGKIVLTGKSAAVMIL